MTEQETSGRRRRFILTLLSEKGTYPRASIRCGDALYAADEGLVYTVVPAEPPNEFNFCEVSWAQLGEIRFWGAMALAVPEGRGFHSFYPLQSRVLCAAHLDSQRVQKCAVRLSVGTPSQSHKLHWSQPRSEDAIRLYEGLLGADNVLLRGVSCFLKAHLFWEEPLFLEEMAINLHISLEAALSVIRSRLSAAEGRAVSYDAVYQFLAGNFPHGETLVEFWRDRRDERNMLLHPDSILGSHPLPPMCVDDVYELWEPNLSLYRYLLLGAHRNSDE